MNGPVIVGEDVSETLARGDGSGYYRTRFVQHGPKEGRRARESARVKQGCDSGTRQTLLFAILLLFFIQLYTLWFESLFRMSLMKLHMGSEFFCLAIVLLPLSLFAVKQRREPFFLRLALVVFLVIRLVCPVLGAAALTVVAGMGVAAFLVLLCYALSSPYRFLQGDMGRAAALAILLSVVFRSWGSSLDISMQGRGAVLGWILAAGAAYLFLKVMSEERTPPETAVRGYWGAVPGVFGLFAGFALLHLVFFNPAVVSAWSGSHYLAGTSLLVLSLAGALFWSGRTMARGSVWGVAITCIFAVLLAGGIYLYAPSLPPLPDSPPLYVFPAPAWMHVPFYLLFLLSPVLPFHLNASVGRAVVARPRNAVVPVVLGTALLLSLSLLLLVSNVWGYSGAAGPLMRNRFCLPFLIAGIAMLLPFFKARVLATAGRPERGFVRVAACVLAALAVAGVIARGARPSENPLERRQLTIMTYNMQQGSNIAGNQSYREQLALLKRVNADIIGLQESDTAKPSCGNVDAVRYFADGLNYFSYYGPNTVSGTFGTAILSRFPLKNPRSFFSFSDEDEIGTSMAEIDAGGKHLTFFDNHPAGTYLAMTAHVKALAAEAKRHDAVVSVGDYNFDQESVWYGSLVSFLGDAWLSIYPDAVGKVPALNPRPLNESLENGVRIESDGRLDMRQRIDHVFFSRDFHVLESHYLPPPESETDHPAHWSVIAWE